MSVFLQLSHSQEYLLVEKQVLHHAIKIMINCPDHGKTQILKVVLSLMNLFAAVCLSLRYTA